MKDLVIIGAGGFAREVAWLVEEINKEKPSWNLIGYIDEDPDKKAVSYTHLDVYKRQGM